MSGQVITLCSIVLALLAAYCWFQAGFASIPFAEAEQERIKAAEKTDGWIEASIGVDGADLFESLKLQASWNRWGAIWAAGSAVCQAFIFGIEAFVVK